MGIVVVAIEDAGAAHDDFPGLALRQEIAIVVDHPNLAFGRNADRPGFAPPGRHWIAGYRSMGFGHAVKLDERDAEGTFEIGDHLLG